jgi:hypothetical protein
MTRQLNVVDAWFQASIVAKLQGKAWVEKRYLAAKINQVGKLTVEACYPSFPRTKQREIPLLAVGAEPRPPK